MSQASKAARAANKAKANRLVKADMKGKVDASDYAPSDFLNADAKTGMRPVSPRQFKKGGKVTGEAHMGHAGRKPRKSGGRAITADSLINRDAKEANESRKGIKHVGGMKKGGRTKYEQGGASKNPRGDENAMSAADEARAAAAAAAARAKEAAAARTDAEREDPRNRKAGGRAKKMDGGPMDPRTGIVPKDVLTFGPGGPKSPVIGLKKGGAAKWEGSAKDEAQDKKLAKKHGMSMKSWESSKMDEKHDKQHSMKGLKTGGKAEKWISGAIKHPGSLHKALHVKEGEKIPAKKLEKAEHSSNPKLAKKARLAETLKKFHKASGGALKEDGEIQGTRPEGGRLARKGGGRAKGKTQIHINIGSAKPAMDQARPPMGGAPMGGPAPMPPMGGAPMGPPPGTAPAGPPAGGMPLGLPPGLAQLIQGRKSGGRTYPKMRYGAGSGLGRLEKIEEYGEPQKRD